jgi:hypothetical protein
MLKVQKVSIEGQPDFPEKQFYIIKQQHTSWLYLFITKNHDEKMVTRPHI